MYCVTDVRSKRLQGVHWVLREIVVGKPAGVPRVWYMRSLFVCFCFVGKTNVNIRPKHLNRKREKNAHFGYRCTSLGTRPHWFFCLVL